MDGPHGRSTDDDASAKRTRCIGPGSAMTKQNTSTSTSSGLVASISHGWISIMGRSRVMQEAMAVARRIEPDRYDFFGLYYGHTGAARWCDHVHELLSKEMKARRVVEVDVGSHGGEEYWREAMEGCFEKMDEEVRGRGGVEVSKAVFMVIGDKDIVVASRGDSTSVLYRGNVALGLSCHSRSEPDDGPNKESPSKPSVRITNRRDEDRFVLIASNSLWDVLSDEVVCGIVGQCLEGERAEEDTMGNLGATKAATVLAGLAMARGSKDNISVLVVQLVNSRGVLVE